MLRHGFMLVFRVFALVLLSSILIFACDDDPAADACRPDCDMNACMTCDNGVCRSTCGPDLACEAGVCVHPARSTCDPACGPCQFCSEEDAMYVCRDACGPGTICRDRACEPEPTATCEPACGPCETCDSSGSQPVCTNLCADGTTCSDGVCAPTQTVRLGFRVNFPDLEGPFDSGPAVTEACLKCHQAEADHFIETAHWKWAGPTPNLVGHENDTTIGKRNLINNFCIAIDSNEARCTQCHAGYGWGVPASENDPPFDFTDTTRIDCLVCHADPAVGYIKDKKTAGHVPVDEMGRPVVDLALAAASVGTPEVKNCGSCHFLAGGGDNVKKGDMASSLGAATPEVDVHLGLGMACVNCHVSSEHRIPGQGVHLPVNEGRIACAGCHTEAPHGNTLLDNHAIDVACETCHIPAFSRQIPTKMRWDWSTAGDRTRSPVTLPFAGGDREDYSWMKGTFVWQQNVRPVYAWHSGRVMHLGINDAFTAAGTPEEPVVISAPRALSTDLDAKIFPFKVMRGRQAADETGRFLIVPDLFGPGSFWGVVGQASNAGTDHRPTANPSLWNQMLTTGARAAGQISPAEAYGDNRAWHFVETEMWMGINHEVAPKEQALDCHDCHDGSPDFDFSALGYLCDPWSDGAIACGSRHPM